MPGKNSAKSRLNSPIFLIALAAVALFPATLFAQGGAVKVFSRQAVLGGRTQATIMILGWQNDAASMEQLIDAVAQRADVMHAQLDWQNQSGDVGRINAAAGSGAVQVSDDTVSAFEEALRISDWTKGWFDIAAYGSGSYRDIKVDRGARKVELKKSGMQVRFDGLAEGFIAEYMVRLIVAANMQNAMVKVGNVFRGVGSGPAGPWKIQVQDSEGTYAHHALNLTVNNNGVATISANEFGYQGLINPKNKQQIAAPCKGVTLVMKNAAQAQGIAKAVFTAGPKDGYELLAKFGKATGLIVDNNGKFIRTAGF